MRGCAKASWITPTSWNAPRTACGCSSTGQTEMGKPMILTVVTSPENWAEMDSLKGILAKLADPRQVANDDEARFLAEQGKAVYWIERGDPLDRAHQPRGVAPAGLQAGFKQRRPDPGASGQPDRRDGEHHQPRRPEDGHGLVLSVQGHAVRLLHSRRTTASMSTTTTTGTSWGSAWPNRRPTSRPAWSGTRRFTTTCTRRRTMLYMSPGNDPTNEAVSPITIGRVAGVRGAQYHPVDRGGLEGGLHLRLRRHVVSRLQPRLQLHAQHQRPFLRAAGRGHGNTAHDHSARDARPHMVQPASVHGAASPGA